jgi:hypothetical protein
MVHDSMALDNYPKYHFRYKWIVCCLNGTLDWPEHEISANLEYYTTLLRMHSLFCITQLFQKFFRVRAWTPWYCHFCRHSTVFRYWYKYLYEKKDRVTFHKWSLALIFSRESWRMMRTRMTIQTRQKGSEKSKSIEEWRECIAKVCRTKQLSFI